jgi:HPr kinase/phosphorylase
MSQPATIHGSVVLVGERGILIRGRSGTGKSALALALLAADPLGARLVADDRVIVAAENGRLIADVPGKLAGLIEMRGVGIVKVPHVAPVVIRLVVDLAAVDCAPRMPEQDEAVAVVEGVTLPRMVLPVGLSGGAARVIAAAPVMTRGEADCLLRCGIE